MTRRRHLVLLGILAVLAGATAAWAYWTAAGSGAAAASTGTLGAPSGVSASTTAGSPTVQLAWTGSALSNGQPPTGYYATRIRTGDGSSTPACGTSPSALTAATGCNDQNVPDGTYHYVITAVYHTWTATSAPSNDVTVTGDTTGPAVTLTFPQDGATYGASGWSGGCPTTGLCGTASDPSGVAAVELSVRQRSSGHYWGGSSFDQASETFLPASGTTAWAFAFARPPDGPYTVHVRATDSRGNTTAPGSYASATFTVDTAAPALSSLQLFDANGNGKVDQVKATFNEPLAASTATAPWTLTSVPSGGTLASVATAGSVATLTINEGAGAASTAVGNFTVALAASTTGVRDAAGNQSSFAATNPADKAAPALVTLQMLDGNANGKVDRVTAAFSETLASYGAGNGPWTLSNVPSGGTLGSVSVSGTTATLAIAEGAGAANTAVGGFTVALATNAGGVRDADANPSTFGATAPADKAGPVVVSISTSVSGGTAGKIEAGDQLTVAFSEPLLASTVPSGANVTETDPSGTGDDTLSITGITNNGRDTGSDGYVTRNNVSVSFASSTVALSGGAVTVTVAGACSGSCGDVGNGQGQLNFAPATGITDAAGNAATGVFATASDFKLF
jgi:hypothetical protein